jgi:hypothetical protein
MSQRDVQPADFETAAYRTVLRRLASLDEDAADQRAEAIRWFNGRVTAADDAVQRAHQELRDAQRQVAAAQRGLEQVDARVAQLWSEYVHKVGPAAERYGRTVPQPAIPRQRGDRKPDEYLEEVANKVKYTPPARPINFGVKVLFWLFGLAGGLTGVAAYRVLRQIGSGQTGSWQDALPVIALVVLLACPVLAVVAAKRVADRRGTSLDAATVATVLLIGLITAGALLGALGIPR